VGELLRRESKERDRAKDDQQGFENGDHSSDDGDRDGGVAEQDLGLHGTAAKQAFGVPDW
jgi:hypothetical protein